MKKLLFTLAIILILTLSAWGDDTRKSGMNLGMSPSPSGGGVSYRLNDSFSTDVAAGSVDGTLAVPGPGTRTVVDTHSPPYLSINSGYLRFSGSLASETDPYIYYGPYNITTGTMLIGSILISNTAHAVEFGYSATPPSANMGPTTGQGFSNFFWSILVSGNYVSKGYPVGSNVELPLAYIQGANVSYLLVKDTLWYFTPPLNQVISGNKYVAVNNASDSDVRVNFIRIPYLLWTPKPISADSFTGALIDSNNFSSSLGNLTEATWSVSGGVAFNAPTLSAEIIPDPGLEGTYTGGLCTGLAQNGGTATQSADVHGGSKAQQWAADAVNEEINYSYTPTSGNWYRLSGWAKKASGPSGSILLGVGQNGVLTYNTLDPGASYGQVIASEKAAGTLDLKVFAYSTGAGPWSTVVVDDFSIKSLTLNSLFATESTSYSDVTVKADVTLHATIAVQAGVVACLDSATNPQTFLICYFDRPSGKVMLDQCVAGSYTNLLAVSASYGAGRTLELDKQGTNITVFYNSTFVGKATCTANTNTRHGLFSTGNGASEASLDNFELRSSGMITDGGGLTGLEAGGNGMTWGGFLSGTGTTGAGVTWDHEWNFSGNLNDNPAAGKTAVNLTKAAGTTTYGTDWANKSNDALAFNGSTYFTGLSNADVCDLGASFTILTEFEYQTGADSYAYLFSNRDATPNGLSFGSRTVTNTLMALTHAAGTTLIDSSFLLTAGKHYQAVLTRDGTNYNFYANGVLVYSTSSGAPGAASGGVTIGASADSSQIQNNNSKISRIATLKGTALTAAQVKAEYEKWVVTSDANIYARLYGGPDPGANGLTNQSGAVTEGTWGSENAGEFSYQAYALRYSTTAGNPGSFNNTTNLLRRTGTWSIAGGKAVNAPVAGAEIATNGTFTGGSTGWTLTAGWTYGTNNLDAATPGYFYGYAQTAGIWYRTTCDIIARTAGDITPINGDGSIGPRAYQHNIGTNYWTFRNSATGVIGIHGHSTFSGTIDNVSWKPLTLNQLITAINHTGTPDVYASVSPTIATGFQAGLALNIDDPSNPTNFNLIYYNQNDQKVYAERCVNGVYANIFASSAQAYSAGKPLVARRIGEGANNMYVWYNNVYVGVGTASPNGTWHGMFQTGASSAETNLDDWFCYGSGTNGEYNILNAFTN